MQSTMKTDPTTHTVDVPLAGGGDSKVEAETAKKKKKKASFPPESKEASCSVLICRKGNQSTENDHKLENFIP